MKIRKGSGYSWSEKKSLGYKGTDILRTTYGFTVDGLNTKNIDEAENVYEKVFVYIRKALEQNESLCCDDVNDRLTICQLIADTLKEGSLLHEKERG
jgi:hypothetical protein